MSTTFGVEPINPDDAKEWQRSNQMCERTGKGGECRLEGPVKFVVTYDDKDFAWLLENDVRALFKVTGSMMECEEFRPVPDTKANADVR